MTDSPRRHFMITLLIALLIIGIATGISIYWVSNPPKAEKVHKEQQAPHVSVMAIKVIDHPTTIYAMGDVIPSQSLNLTSRISGMVTELGENFIEGGRLQKGEKIVQLDPTDFRLVIEQRKSDLAQAEFKYKLEQGQQAIAKQEYELLGSTLSQQERELVLRKPHLNAARSNVSAATARLKQAQLDLERTLTVSPFNAIILNRNANIGSWISTFSTGTPLAKLVSTDNFWIDTSLPMDKLKWLSIPGLSNDLPSAVKVMYDSAWGEGIFRKGMVKRLKAEVEPAGRMAKLIIEVNDPLSLYLDNKGAPSMVLGTFVRVAIEGKVLKDVIALPESVLHDGRSLWLVDQQQTLMVQEVKPIWSEQGLIYLPKKMLAEGVRVITSNLSTPVVGMDVHVVEE